MQMVSTEVLQMVSEIKKEQFVKAKVFFFLARSSVDTVVEKPLTPSFSENLLFNLKKQKTAATVLIMIALSLHAKQWSHFQKPNTIGQEGSAQPRQFLHQQW